MDKAKVTMIGIVGLIVVLLGAGLFYIRGLDVSTDDVVVLSTSATEAQTVAIKGDESTITVTDEDETQTTRGLKSYEIESVQEALDKLRIRWGEPNAAMACEGEEDPDSFLLIKDGNRTGTIYFCGGVGVDETGNILGPYHDLLKIVDDLAADTTQ